MCMAITQGANAYPLSRSAFGEHAEDNPHGIGIAFPHAGEVKILRWLPDEPETARYLPRFTEPLLDAIFAQYTAFVGTRPLLLHFRYATHGALRFSNTHPIPLGRDAAFIHNGIIPTPHQDARDLRSDTVYYRDTVLKALPSSFYLDAATRAKLAQGIAGSRLAFLDARGNLARVNESFGYWSPVNPETWYSRRPYSYAESGATWRGHSYYSGWEDWTEEVEAPQDERADYTRVGACLLCGTEVYGYEVRIGAAERLVTGEILCEDCGDQLPEDTREVEDEEEITGENAD